jgi:hypothetical protein
MTLEDRIAALAITSASVSARFDELRVLREKVRLAEAELLVGQRPNEVGVPRVLPTPDGVAMH